MQSKINSELRSDSEAKNGHEGSYDRDSEEEDGHNFKVKNRVPDTKVGQI